MLLIYFQVEQVNKLLRLEILFSELLSMLLFHHNTEMTSERGEAVLDHIQHKAVLDNDEFQQAIPLIQ